jgi:hypothetical protein
VLSMHSTCHPHTTCVLTTCIVPSEIPPPFIT